MSEIKLNKKYFVIGSVVAAVGILLLILTAVQMLMSPDGSVSKTMSMIGLILVLFGAFFAVGILPNIIFGPLDIRPSNLPKSNDYVQPEIKTLPDEVKQEREEYAENKNLPGIMMEEPLNYANVQNYLVRPSAYPLTPMYLLDKNFRILDWNDAFSLAFDKTMEGLMGSSVLEWTYHLENYQEVLDHGEVTFTDPENFPDIDVENIVFKSLRFDTINAVKRAYKIPADNGETMAWLVTLELNFEEKAKKKLYKKQLLKILAQSLMWSEYTLSYDNVLRKSNLYKDLLNKMIEVKGHYASPEEDSKVIDLGAGTGNLSVSLIERVPSLEIDAVENNNMMIEMMRDKCSKYLRGDESGISIIKQDVTILQGFRDEEYDYAFANNVFYALNDFESCLREVWRVLKPGGELRLSGPRSDTSLKVLFEKIEEDLQDQGEFERLKEDFYHVKEINDLRLMPLLHKWSIDDFCKILTDKIGFSEIIYTSREVYADQSMLICARK